MRKSTILKFLFLAMLMLGAPWSLAQQSDPVIQYLFEEGSGTNAMNSGSLGSSADGALEGPAFSNTTPSGTGFSLLFPNQGGLVRIPDVFDYVDPITGGPLNQITVECWVMPIETDTLQMIWDDFMGGSGSKLRIRKGGVEFTVATESDPLGANVIGGIFGGGSWTHIAGIYNGSDMRVYINGQDSCLFTPTSGAILQGNTTKGPLLGAAVTGLDPRFYSGYLDDFRVHPRALAPRELAGGVFGEPAACPVCGDGVVESTEQCDPTGSPCSNGATCSNTCTCSSSLTYNGTAWDVDVLTLLERQILYRDLFTFSEGSFTSEVSAQEGCAITSFEEFEEVIRNVPRLRFTAKFSCPNGEERQYEGATDDLWTMKGWIRINGVLTNAIEGQLVPPTIPTTALPDAAVAVAYSAVLSANGGRPPYSWGIIAGSLPPGLVLDAAGGVVSGTPTAAGDFPVTVQVSDVSGSSVTADLMLTVKVDAVAITQAIWDRTKLILAVRASSSAAPNVTLTVVGFGGLNFSAATNTYQKVFPNVTANPGTVTVTSGGGGSAIATVRTR